jgi:hypothetical protein
MLLTALLLLASPAEASVQTRDGIIQAYRQMVAEQDRDHDGRVSRAEWQAVVDRMFPPTPRPGEEASNYSEVRASSAGLLDYWDANGDSIIGTPTGTASSPSTRSYAPPWNRLRARTGIATAG